MAAGAGNRTHVTGVLEATCQRWRAGSRINTTLLYSTERSAARYRHRGCAETAGKNHRFKLQHQKQMKCCRRTGREKVHRRAYATPPRRCREAWRKGLRGAECARVRRTDHGGSVRPRCQQNGREGLLGGEPELAQARPEKRRQGAGSTRTGENGQKKRW